MTKLYAEIAEMEAQDDGTVKSLGLCLKRGGRFGRRSHRGGGYEGGDSRLYEVRRGARDARQQRGGNGD